MSIRRREVLALGVAFLAFTVAGCSPFALARSMKTRKVRKYLSGLDGVTSVEVHVHPNLVFDDDWNVTVKSCSGKEYRQKIARTLDTGHKRVFTSYIG